jgi:signal transduction histidine kinase
LAAVMIFGIFLIIYVSRIISRIKKLERDVAIVSGGETSHIISNNGRDEIATLSENVEAMRISIIDKLNKEREIKEANNELITSISHDLRTPLTVLIGYIDMMKNHEDCKGELYEYITASESTAMRLKHLSDDMFKYSLAFGEPDSDIKLESYDAETLFDQLLSEHILLLSERGFDVRKKRTGRSFDGMKVHTDAPNLMRIIDNIFSNLSKYAEPSEPIEFTIERVGLTVILEIKNRIKTESPEVESNGIGLKSCTRLAKLIAEGFTYGEDDGFFICRLTLKLCAEGGRE